MTELQQTTENKYHRLCEYSLYALAVTTVWPNIGFVRELAGVVALVAFVIGYFSAPKPLIRYAPLRHLIILSLLAIPLMAVIPVWGDTNLITQNLDQAWNTYRAAIAGGLCLLVLRKKEDFINLFTVGSAAVAGFVIPLIITDITYGNIRPINTAFNRNDLSMICFVTAFGLWLIALLPSLRNAEIPRRIKLISCGIIAGCAYIFFSQKFLSVPRRGFDTVNFQIFSPQIIPLCLLLFLTAAFIIYKRNKTAIVLYGLTTAAIAVLQISPLPPIIEPDKALPLIANINAQGAQVTMLITIACALSLSLYLVLFCTGKLRTITSLILVGVLYSLVFYCGSRNIMAVLLLTIPTIVLIKSGRYWKKFIIPLAVFALCVITALGFMMQQRKKYNPVSSADGRLYLWYHSADVAKENLLTGAGYGMKNFNRAWQEKDRTVPQWMNPQAVSELKTNAQHAHNLILQIIAERGVLGLFLLLMTVSLFMAYCVIRMPKAEAGSCADEQKIFARVGFLAIASILLAQTLSFFFRQNIETVCWITLCTFIAGLNCRVDYKKSSSENFWQIRKQLRLLTMRFMAYPMALIYFILLYTPVRADFVGSSSIASFYHMLLYPAVKAFSLPLELMPRAAGIANILLATIIFIVADCLISKRITKDIPVIRLLTCQIAVLTVLSIIMLKL